METTKNLSQDQRDTILKRFNVTQKDISGTIGGEEDEDYCDSWQELKIDVDFFNIC